MINVADDYDTPRHGPDDLMDIPIESLVRKLARRVQRLRKFNRMYADPRIIRKEKHLIRIAEIAARARVRELNALAHQLLVDALEA